MEIKLHNHKTEERVARITTAYSFIMLFWRNKYVFCSFMCFHFVCNRYIQISGVDILKLFCEKSNFKQMYTCSSKKCYSTNSRTCNLKKWVVKNRLSLYIWIVALLCSIFILVWFSFLCICLCNIYYMIVIFILEIEGYWNNRLAQLPGGAPDTRVTYKVCWFLGSYHVVMSLQDPLPLLGSHDVSRSVCCNVCCSSKYHFHENYFEDPT